MKRWSVVLVILAAWAAGACNASPRARPTRRRGPAGRGRAGGHTGSSGGSCSRRRGDIRASAGRATSHAPRLRRGPRGRGAGAARSGGSRRAARTDAAAHADAAAARPRCGHRARDRAAAGASTKTAKAEDPVVAELAEDVSVDGEVLLPAGAEVHGHVVSSVRSGRVKGRARLVVAFRRGPRRRPDLQDRRDRLRRDRRLEQGQGREDRGRRGGAGVLIGAIAGGGSGALKGGLIGGAAGGAAVLATRGVEVELAAGSRYKIELKKSLRAALSRASSRRSAQRGVLARRAGSSSPARRSRTGRLRGVARVAEGHGHVAQQPAALGALHRAPAEALAEGLVVEAREVARGRGPASPGRGSKAGLAAAGAACGSTGRRPGRCRSRRRGGRRPRARSSGIAPFSSIVR